MYYLAVTLLLRRAGKSTLVSLTIVFKGVKAEAAARTHKILISGRGWGGIGNLDHCLHLKQNCPWILLFGYFSLLSPGLGFMFKGFILVLIGSF